MQLNLVSGISVLLAAFAVVASGGCQSGNGSGDSSGSLGKGPPRFDEVELLNGTAPSPSYGLCIGDLNGDGNQDLVATNHSSLVSIWLGAPGGQFRPVSSQFHDEVKVPLDSHGCSFADVDNDGRQELLVIGGGSAGIGAGSDNALIRLSGGRFSNIAARSGVNYPLGRGRNGSWVDMDADGRIDLILANAHRPGSKAPSAILRNTPIGFENLCWIQGRLIRRNWFVGLPLSSSGNAEPLISLINEWEIAPSMSLRDGVLSSDMKDITIPHVKDFAVSDFDNDLEPDVVFVRKNDRLEEITQPAPGEIRFALSPKDSPEAISFQADSPVEATFYSHRLTNPGWLKSGDGGNLNSLTIALDPSSTAFLEDETYAADADSGKGPRIDVAHARNSRSWTITTIPGPKRFPVNIWLRSRGEIKPLSRAKPGLNQNVRLKPVFVRDVTRALQRTVSPIDYRLSCNGVTAADFDNDMDVDLVFACSSLTSNLGLYLYLNDGRGKFSRSDSLLDSDVPSGLSDKVISPDLNEDGFPDLVWSNGYGQGPWRGPLVTMLNRGNSNHWLEIKLQGSDSNRDGVGAVVTLEAGGMKQVRQQWGGVHFGAQESERIHFGLGTSKQADAIEVRWPSGNRQVLEDQAVDRIIVISEP